VTPLTRAIAMTALLAAAAALWLGWRYETLGRAVAANRRALGAALAPVPGETPDDASRRVALAVEASERRFDETLALIAARHTAGVLSLACAGVGAALGLGALAYRRRSQNERRSP